MKVKTAILTGNALRWAVFVANGMVLRPQSLGNLLNGGDWVVYDNGTIRRMDYIDEGHRRVSAVETWAPDTDDDQAGSIIDEYRICTVWDGSCWIGCMHEPFKQDWYHNQTGSTRLLAAMRTFVSFKFGSEVDLPDGIACT